MDSEDSFMYSIADPVPLSLLTIAQPAFYKQRQRLLLAVPLVTTLLVGTSFGTSTYLCGTDAIQTDSVAAVATTHGERCFWPPNVSAAYKGLTRPQPEQDTQGSWPGFITYPGDT